MRKKLGPYLCQLSPHAGEKIVKKLNTPVSITIKIYENGAFLASETVSVPKDSSDGAVYLAALELETIKQKRAAGFRAEQGVFRPNQSLTVRLRSQTKSVPDKPTPPEPEKKEKPPKKRPSPFVWAILALIIGLAIWATINTFQSKNTDTELSAPQNTEAVETSASQDSDTIETSDPQNTNAQSGLVSNARARTIVADNERVSAVRQAHTLLYTDPFDWADWSNNVAAQWEGVQSVAVGAYHLLALMSDGTVRAASTTATSPGNKGEFNVSDWKDVVKVLADEEVSVGLTSDGRVLTVKSDSNFASQVFVDEVSTWEGIVDFACGYGMAAGVRTDGTVVLGGHTYNTAGDDMIDYFWDEVRDWTDIVQVEIGYFCMAGLRADGTVVVTSYCSDDAESWTDIKDIVFEKTGNTLVGLRSDGTVVMTPQNENRDLHWADVSGWTDIAEIACTRYGVIGVHSDGTVITAAWDYSSQTDWSVILETAATWTDILTR